MAQRGPDGDRSAVGGSFTQALTEALTALAPTTESTAETRPPWRMTTFRTDGSAADEYFAGPPHDYAEQLSQLTDVDRVRIELAAAPAAEWYEYRAGERSGSAQG